MKNLIVIIFLQLMFFDNVVLLAQWTKMNSPEDSSVYALLITGPNYFTRTSKGLYISNDQGNSWRSIHNGLPELPYSNIWCIAVNSTHTFVGFDGDGVFVSTNNGTDWNPANNGLSNKRVNCLVTNGNNIFAGTIQGGIFRSTNNGNSWEEVNNGIPTNQRNVNSFATSSSKIFTAISMNGIYVSSNNGFSWQSLFMSSKPDLANIAVNGQCIYSAIYKTGVYYSTDDGLNWTHVHVGPRHTTSYDFAFSDSNVFVANGDGVFLSTDYGKTWEDVNSNMTVPFTGATSLTINNDNIYAIYAREIWYRSILEILPDIDDNQDILPSRFALEQNYPNPFNPITTIKYSIPKSQFVTLKVFDLLGREITILVNEHKNVGNYEVKFDASSFTSGIYFYRLQARDFSETKKLVLLK